MYDCMGDCMFVCFLVFSLRGCVAFVMLASSSTKPTKTGLIVTIVYFIANRPYMFACTLWVSSHSASPQHLDLHFSCD